MAPHSPPLCLAEIISISDSDSEEEERHSLNRDTQRSNQVDDRPSEGRHKSRVFVIESDDEHDEEYQEYRAEVSQTRAAHHLRRIESRRRSMERHQLRIEHCMRSIARHEHDAECHQESAERHEMLARSAGKRTGRGAVSSGSFPDPDLDALIANLEINSDGGEFQSFLYLNLIAHMAM